MKKLGFLLLFTSSSLVASATHLRGGHISVKRASLVTLTCEITVTVYTDTNCTNCILFGGDFSVLNFGDGSQTQVPETQNSPLPGFNGVGYAQFTVMHTFAANTKYLISFSEPNRNDGVRNMDFSVGTPFYIQTSIDLAAGFKSTPDFLATPVFFAPIDNPNNNELSMSLGAVSEEDYIPYYQLGIPKKDRNVPVDNYRLPESIKINPHTGLITWDGRFENFYFTGEYAFTIQVTLFKERDNSFVPVCTVFKDIQIIFYDSDYLLTVSSNAELGENGRIYVPVNDSKIIKIFFEENSPSEEELTVFSELESNDAAFSFSSYDSTGNPSIKVGVVTFTSLSAITRENPYLVTVRRKRGVFSKDFSLLLFTQDVQLKLLEYAELITDTDDAEKLVEVYPNPSADVFNFSFSESQSAAISIHDLTGKLVHVSFSVGPISIDLRHLQSGFYRCTISSGSSLMHVKLLKN